MTNSNIPSGINGTGSNENPQFRFKFNKYFKGLKTYRRSAVMRSVMALVLLGSVTAGWYFSGEHQSAYGPKLKKIRSSFSPHAGIKAKSEREEYIFKMLRDPATNSVPQNIREHELRFADILDKATRKLRKTQVINWYEAGPTDVGGRTRALAVDMTNPDVVFAGGASGGVWKSTDNGNTWQLKSEASQILGVTSIAQDPQSPSTWYYTTGEYYGSAPDMGYRAFYFGNGVYKSTDNGETWRQLASTASTNPTSWSGYFSYASKVVVSKTGTVFVAANGMGIFRSNDGGNNFTMALGGTNQHQFSDIVVASDGTLLAALSTGSSTPANKPGIYRSADDGQSWVNITPASGYPSSPMRSVIATAPSNPAVAYIMTQTPGVSNEIKFFKLNISTGTVEDRTANLPSFSADVDGFINLQDGYNMMLAVKPDDENFVIMGATSLFRSANGFAAKPSSAMYDWIGGYHPSEFFYPGLHPDIHAFAFDPQSPDKMWIGHDGGLSYTTNIKNRSYSRLFPWIKKNNGYNVTQFYMVTIPRGANDYRIMGGTQDNGTPYFTFDGQKASAFADVSSGDGAFAYFGQNYAYTSAQEGYVLRLHYNSSGDIDDNTYSAIAPDAATGQLFINPFAVDPSDEQIMYYPAGNKLWRNNNLSAIPEYADKTSQGWSQLKSFSVSSGYEISALAVSRTNPSHILYVGASSNSGQPVIYRLENANTSTLSPVKLSIPGAASGAYIHNVAVNPVNGKELLVVMSNYNIVGLYHSIDGGNSFTAIEGNLTGDSRNPGPSLRSASILPVEGGTMYFVGTSVGLYSTDNLNGNSTLWMQEGAGVMGNVIVNYVDSRPSDGRVIAGTHGRGAFVANVKTSAVAAGQTQRPQSFSLEQNFPNPFNPSTTIRYSIAQPEMVRLTVYDISGREVATLVNENKSEGSYEVQFNARNLASGVYLYRLKAGGFEQTRKFVLMK